MRNDEIKYIGIRLISGLKFLEFDDIETAKPCVKTAQGYKGCKLFLANIEAVNEILGIKACDRNYRENFTKNYKSLFPDFKRRMYRVDVLEASIEGYTSIWVNGEKFEFNSNVIIAGKILYENWICLITLMFQLKDMIEQKIKDDKYLDIFEFEDDTWKINIIDTLKKFDECWVLFEEKYINELISIENIARRFVLNVYKYMIDNEIVSYLNNNNEIYDKELNKKIIIKNKEKLKLDSIFFDLIKNLYHVLNINNKQNISENINLTTWQLLQEIDILAINFPHTSYSIISIISETCKNELINLMENIIEICNFPEKIDPHICNNINLQQLIIRVEDSWRILNKYISKSSCLNIDNIENLSLVQLIKLLEKIFLIQILIRERILKRDDIDKEKFEYDLKKRKNQLIEKLEECDVGAFLTLPKICCILYLINPINCSDIMTRFLDGNIKLNEYELNNNLYNKDKLNKKKIFKRIELIKSILIDNKTIQESFYKMINFWNLLSNKIELNINSNIGIYSLNCDSDKKLILNEKIFLIYIYSIFTGQCLCGLNQINNCNYCNKEYNLLLESELIKNCREYLDSLILSIEEISILLQRVNPLEWNEFIQIITICITKSYKLFESRIIIENEYLDDKNLFNNDLKNNINNNENINIFKENKKEFNLGNKFQEFLNSISSIFYNGLMYYGEYNVNSSSSNLNNSINQDETFFTNSDSNLEESSIL